ncbi:MAG: Nif3-like dinuclear metal center hexameric protein [Planctomycetaceae bacterium]
MQLSSLIKTLSDLAPLDLAEDWDNVGLLLGDESAEVARVMTCLTLTPDVAVEAVKENVGLVVTHHPLMFKPIQRISSATSEGAMIVSLLKHGVAVYSPHTAWDNASQGINQQLAEILELQNIAPLRPRPCEEQVQIVTFVPIDHRLAVQRALWDAGAGVIGDYRQCSYYVSGKGTFYGTEAAHPAVGQTGRLEEVAEDRLEVVCPAHLLSKALTRLREAHPYEEPAIDVYPRRSLPSSSGAGRQGDLPSLMPLGELNCLVCQRLNTPVTPIVGDANQVVTRIGIACAPRRSLPATRSAPAARRS